MSDDNVSSLLINKGFYQITGQSMMPILKDRDRVSFEKISFKNTKINQLLLIKKKDYFVHRVIYKTNKYIITKGDSNLRSDGKVYPRQIVGRVRQIKRDGQIINPESLYLIQSTIYFQEIVKIKKAFEKEKIDYVILKGLPLHLFYEKTHPQRIYMDCDILIHRKDLLKVEKILFSNNYKKAEKDLSKTHNKLKNTEIERSYIKIINDSVVVFDLHLEAVFMMTQLGSLNALYPHALVNQLTEEFIKTKRKIKINNDSLWILDTEYLIPYLTLHVFHHNFRGAFRYDFLDKVIRKALFQQPTSNRSGCNWVGIASKIEQFKLNNFVYPVFILLKKYYQTPIPASFLKSIQPVNPLIREFVNKIIKTSIFNDQPRIRAGVNRFKNLFYLSPEPLWKKLWVFVNPQVVFSIFWIAKRKLFSFFSGRKQAR